MSNLNNQRVSYWSVAEDFILAHLPQMYSSTTRINHDDKLIIRDAYFLWYLATEDTLSSFQDSNSFSDRLRWLKAICSLPVKDLVDILKLGAHLLVTSDAHSYIAFKQQLCMSFPFAGAIIAPVKKVIDDWLVNTNTNSLRLLYSWFLFISRLNLNGIKQLEQEALVQYLRLEHESKQEGFTCEECLVLQKWFPNSLENQTFLTEHHDPQHGPGSTADAGTMLAAKYLALAEDTRIHMLNKRVYGDICPYPRLPEHNLLRCSKTIFVPKSLGSYRTISMEPAALMWHQKGVRNALLKMLNFQHHYLTRRFSPDRQEPNRDLAWTGSVDGSFATIDLSSASDTVSWRLVKEWFHNTCLYPWLLWTRSTSSLLPDGQTIKLNKYAPMGSDLCFPIETIVFAAIVECSITECGGDPKLSKFRVYGDDIVIEKEYAQTVCNRLVMNGFILNEDKSFHTEQPRGFFRESCGGFYFNGCDITPTRLSRRFDGYSNLGATTPARIERLIEFSNDCYSRYPSVRTWLVKKLISLPIQLRPLFSTDGSSGLFSTQPTNFHLKKNTSASLQTDCYTYGMTKSRKGRHKEEWEDIRLYEYLRQTRHRARLTWPEDRVDVCVSLHQRSVWKSRRSPIYQL